MSFQNPRNPLLHWVFAIGSVLLAAFIIYMLPPVRAQVDWRLDLSQTYLRQVINPSGALPTPEERTTLAPSTTPTPTFTLLPDLPTPTIEPSPTIVPTSTPIPGAVSLPLPAYEKQGPNNCGPASLTMYLRYYGWVGTQDDIAGVVKPISDDRNVNPEELVYFVRNHAGWLSAEFRVGGDIDLLRKLIAGGFPVIIEESFYSTQPFWPNDDLWAAHYLLLTGYDDTAQTFTIMDSFHEEIHSLSYEALDREWQIFNRVFLLVYLPGQQAALQSILGSNWDADTNREHALEVAQAETLTNPNNAYAWFNLGSNLVYFGDYGQATAAYDTARTLGLPQRMLRYQFGPFFAYFHAHLDNDLLALSEYALEITHNAEEALLWHGWALYRLGDTNGAIGDWNEALAANPGYQDARYALDFVGSAP